MDRENSFVFYRSFKESIDNSPSEDRLVLYEAIANYALNGTSPDLSGGTIKMIWPLKMYRFGISDDLLWEQKGDEIVSVSFPRGGIMVPIVKSQENIYNYMKEQSKQFELC